MSIILAFILAIVPGLSACVHTEPFTDADGRPLAGSIATIEDWTINGVEQRLWLRGADVAALALILLHGGPGISESALFRHYDAALEQHFLVVYWDQRGAGRSYHGDIPAASMTVEQFERDLDAVVDRVRQRFHKDKVVLLAHSWGAVLGTPYAAQHADKVAAYVAVAPLVDTAQQDRLSIEFARSEAARRGDTGAESELRAIGDQVRTVDNELALGRIVERYGGTFHENRLSTGKLIWAALQTDEAGLLDLVKFGAGNRFSLQSLWPQYSTANVTDQKSFAMPVIFMLGRHDWHVPTIVAARYFATIDAPGKRLLWFEQSAHNPPFEEPETFIAAMVDVVLPLVKGNASARSTGVLF